MKTTFCKLIFAAGILLLGFSCPYILGQDSISQQSQMLDLKLQLLDSKLDLLDTKIKLWEAKPKELDIKLNEINSKVNSMDFDPQLMTKKLNEMDSLMKVNQSKEESPELMMPENNENRTVSEQVPDFIPSYNSSIMLDPVRLLEGTFYMSYERVLKPAISVSLGAMGTYSTTQGISNYYFSNQSFAFFDLNSNSYQTYEGEVMSGWGLNIQLRNYLLANHPGRKQAPYGLYAAPQIMYRRITITGNYKVWEDDEEGHPQLVDKKVVQHLNINAAGAILGIKIPLFNVLTIDLFAGGNIKLSKYKDEEGFTKYKDWFNIDFSGVSPVAGIAIGILR
jgi:hypothetical protein